MWRELRAGVDATTQARGADTGVLITDKGEAWRNYRVEKLVPYSAIVLGAMIGIWVLYYLVRGKIRIEHGRSGRRIRRSTTFEIVVHWFVAITFVALGLTGLVLLYGRWVLIPVLGGEGFGATAQVAKWIHDYVGLAFVVAVPLMFVTFLKDNLYNLKVDGKWFLRAGGYLGGPEPSSEKINAGQKTWFWTAIIAGAVLCGSGLIMFFPNILQESREFMQNAHLLHTVAAVVVLAFFTVHLYLASVGVEGALEAMTTGYVDENWAKQHHDLWYAEVKERGEIVDAPSDTAQKA
jgi:formate dehydrogenase subunit gamma